MTLSLQGFSQEKCCSCTDKKTAQKQTNHTAPRYSKGYVNPNHHIASNNAQPLFDKADGTPVSANKQSGSCSIRQHKQIVVTECTGTVRPPVPVFQEMEADWIMGSENTYTGQYPAGSFIAPQNGNDAYHRK